MTGRSDAKNDLTPQQRDRLRRALRRMWLTLLPVLPATAVLLAITHWVSPEPTAAPGHHSPPTWLFIIVLGALLLIVLPVEVWFVSRRFHRPGTARDLLVGGEPRDIRRVVKMLRRQQPIADEDGGIAQAYVNSAARQLRMFPWLIGGMFVLCAIVVFLAAHANRPFPWLLLVMFMVLLVVLGAAVSMTRRSISTAREQGIVVQRKRRP